MSASVNFTTEAGSPPIEIAKLDTVLTDMAAELTNSVAADGQTNPTANLPMNGFKHTDVAAATALTHYARVSELIDQDHVFYVDSGAADAYVITPNPDITAYEEGQRFVFRAANNNTGASTLNVNARGAIAIQTPDGSALAAGAILAGGYYEVVYDANATPDRWVLMSPPSTIPDGMLSDNVPLKDAENLFTSGASIHLADNVSLYLGSGTDFTAFHNGTDTVWSNDNGDLNISNIDGDIALTASGDVVLDGVASSDFARLSQSNTFTSSGAGPSTAAVHASAASPWVRWTETDASSGSREWVMGVSGTSLVVAAQGDGASTLDATPLVITRTGTTIDSISFTATELTGNSVDMTPEAGSFELTIATGLSTTPSGTVKWQRLGNWVLLHVVDAISGTSDSTGMTFSGLPAGLRPAANTYVPVFGLVDNSLSIVGAVVVGTAGGATAQAAVDSGGKSYYTSTGFTGSGTKGLDAGAVIGPYLLDTA